MQNLITLGERQMKTKKSIKAMVMMFLLCLIFSCEDCITNSEEEPDTTSHNFIWEIDEVGKPGTLFRDVFAISEDNFWAVGNIETDSGEYNASHWNGTKWELLGIYSNTADLYSIHYFSENDIWVTSHCLPLHWDGNEWTRYHLNNMGINACAGNAIWGTSSSNMYFVGLEGSIVHYDGQNFVKMESGTDINLLDVWGTSDDNIWVCGWNECTGESVILHFDGSDWSRFYEWTPSTGSNPVPRDSLRLMITSLWSDPDQPDTLVAVGGWGAFHVPTSGAVPVRWSYPWRWDLGTGDPMGFPQRVRGSRANNIFVVGQRNSILHYNGHTWHNYLEWYNPTLEGVWFRSVAVHERFAVMVGENVVYKAFNKQENE